MKPGINHVLCEPFVSHSAVVALNVGVLMRLPGFDKVDTDAG